MPDIDPGDLGRRSFRTSFRGFDTDEVRRFLASVAEEVQALLDERDEMAARLRAGGERDLQTEFAAVSREVGEVLEAARTAAEGMRERAAAESARWRSEALAEAEATRKQAMADAEQLRGDAWTTAEELLKQCQREASRILDESREESLRLVGESERQAHRIQGSARREADDVLRTARMEAERLVVDAQTRHDEIIESAHRQAEVAQERTRALEHRRDELRRELDAVRASLVKAEGELDERRELLGLSQPETVEESRGESGITWAPGETVRVVKPQRPGDESVEAPPPAHVAPEDVDRELGSEIRIIKASELAKVDEAAREEQDRGREEGPEQLDVDDVMGGRGSAARSEGKGPEDEEPAPPELASGESAREDSPVPAEPEAPADVEEPQESPASPAPEPEEQPRSGRGQDVFGLFAKLRAPRAQPEGTPGDETVSPEPAAEAGTPEEAPASRDEAPGDGPSGDSAPAASGIDPFELRDRLLLPIANRALRDLKRSLTEQQNAALEEIRLHDAQWTPDPAVYAGAMGDDLRGLAVEAFDAGQAAASELGGRGLPRQEPPADDPSGAVGDELARDLEHVLAEGRSHEEGERALAANVSRVFRAWRTDESERRVRDLSLEAFHRGLLAAAAAGGITAHRWVVAGRGCATCRAAAEEASPDRLPPVHPGCGCTVVPAAD